MERYSSDIQNVVELRIGPEHRALAEPTLVRDALEGYVRTLALPVRINV